VIVCAGKVYYDLLAERRKREITDIAIIRLEQLYPFPAKEYEACLLRYPNVEKITWSQEEPKNQGAWYSSQHHFQRPIKKHFPNIVLGYAGREASAAAAAGYPALHIAQLEKFLDEAMK